MTPSIDVDVPGIGPVGVAVDDRHHARDVTFLLLHGGAGVITMSAFADRLAERFDARVLLPTHPGFGGTPRSDALADVATLARLYGALLDQLDVRDVTVIGNSFGGWVAAEMAIGAAARIGAAVVIDGIGPVVDGHPLADVSRMTPQELRALSFHDPGRAPVPADPSTPGPSPDVRALIDYGGPSMSDPTLLARLAGVTVPTRVLWGESDGIVDPDYGRAYAAAIPGAEFVLLPRTGHLPQVETPDQVLDALEASHRPGPAVPR